MSGECREAEKACLHCEQTPTQIKRDQTICGIESGYEYVELEHEWPRHRWADWNDKELSRQGVRPEAFERHRRTPVTHIQWIDCEDTVSGHNIAKENHSQEFGIKLGQCWSCGITPTIHEDTQ